MVRFVATADWQLGMPAARLPEADRARFAQARFDVIERIGQVAREHTAEFVVVAGDVFDSNQLHRSVVARAGDALAAIDVPVYLLPGNHDPLDASTIYRTREFAAAVGDHVHVVESPGLLSVAEGVDLVVAPWYSKRPARDLVSAVLEDISSDPQRVRILLAHGGLLGIDRDDPAAIDESALQAATSDGRVDVAILGDRHSLTEVTPRIWYPGAPEVTSFREVDPGQVLVVSIEGHNVDVEPVRVGRWRFIDHEERLDSDEDLDRLERRLADISDKPLSRVRLALTATLTLAQMARLDDMVELASERCADAFVWQRTSEIAVRVDDADFADLELAGFAAGAVDDLRNALDGPQAETAHNALKLLYRLAGGAS